MRDVQIPLDTHAGRVTEPSTMKIIWKYRLSQDETQWLQMPKGARILTVQIQHNCLCLWALVDSAALEERLFMIVGTGYPFSAERAEYIGTFQVLEGKFVFHVFEVKSR